MPPMNPLMENPYAAPASTEVFLDEPRPQVLASFGMRFVATILDGIWLAVLNIALGTVIYGTGYFASEKFIEGPADIFISYVLPIAIVAWFWVKKGATPGKMICGIRIITVDGSPLTIGKCLVRYIGYYLSMIPLALGYLWAAWDQRSQAWHDKMARTLVVKVR